MQTSTTIRHAMILAAGLGRRMRPLTDQCPKPLIEVAGVTLLDRALDLVQRHGVERVVVNAAYRRAQVKDHLARRAEKNILISEEPEDQPLETGGGIAKALPLLGEGAFFSLNSDVIALDGTQPLLRRMEEQWDERAMDILLLLHPVQRALGYDGKGDFFLQDDGTLRRRGEAPLAPYVFAGVQIIHPRCFKDVREQKFSMNVLYDAPEIRVRGLAHDGDWLHVGDSTALAQANEYFYLRY